MDIKMFNTLRSYMRDCSLAFYGEYIPICDETVNDEIGWCDSNAIFLNYKHPILNKFQYEKQIVILLGVFTHELMHKIYTDFNVLSYGLKKYKDNKKMFRLVREISNIVEDPAIEYFSRYKVGGYLQQCLLFTIKSFYDLQPDITTEKSAIEQLMAALIMFGDMGIIKGEWTFPEARETFVKVINIFNKAIEEPSAAKRFTMSEEISKIIYPMIENDDSFIDDMDNFNDNQAKNGQGTSIPLGRGKAKEQLSESDIINNRQPNNRSNKKKTIKNICNQMNNERKTPTSEVYDYQNDNVNELKEGEELTAEKIYELTKDDIKAIVEEVKKSLEMNQESEARVSDIDFISKTFQNVKYGNLNIKVKNSTMEYNEKDYNTLKYEYAKVINRVGNNILLLNKYLTKIFRQDKEEKEYKSTGTLSINRFASGRMSTRMFTKTRNPKNKNKMKVCLLIDESGSMSSSNKSLMAKNIAIILAEVFGKLNIPLAVIGFTTSNSNDVVQHHYLHWDNTYDNRLKLLNISSYKCNFDAYTIRYATKMMKNKKSEYDIMIIISDGEPSGGPGSRATRFTDTANAVKEAKKEIGNVVGIGLGNIDIEVFKRFYGKDFIHVKKIDDLPIMLINQIKNIVKKW